MRPLLLVATLLLAVRTYAQDNIVLRNGDEIPAKVLEINQSDLKYRKAANPDGPIYTTPLRDVFLVKYANGTKDVFNAGSTTAPTATPAPASGCRSSARRVGPALPQPLAGAGALYGRSRTAAPRRSGTFVADHTTRRPERLSARPFAANLVNRNGCFGGRVDWYGGRISPRRQPGPEWAHARRPTRRFRTQWPTG